MLEFLNEIFIIIDGKEIKLYNTQDFMDTEDSVILNLSQDIEELKSGVKCDIKYTCHIGEENTGSRGRASVVVRHMVKEDGTCLNEYVISDLTLYVGKKFSALSGKVEKTYIFKKAKE